MFKFFKIPSNISEIIFYILVSSLIFITVGDNLIDYRRIIILKIIIITFIIIQIDFNLYKKIKSDILVYKNISILISFFLIIVTLSYIFSPYQISDFAFKWIRIRYLHVISDIALFIALFFYFRKIGINYNYLAYSIIIPGIIFSISILFLIIHHKTISNNSDQMIFFDGIRQTGMMLGSLVIFISAYILINYNPKYKSIGYFCTTLLLSLIFLLQGRGDLISILFSYFFIFSIFLYIKKDFKVDFIILIFVFFVAYLVSQLLMNYIDMTIQHFEFKETRSLLYTADRIDLWKYTIRKYLENPLLGKGPGSFSVMSFSDHIYGKFPFLYPHAQPHNMILQFLIEWGIIGTSILLILLIKIFIKSFKILINYKKLILLIPGLLIIRLTIHGMVDGTFFHPTFTFLIVLLLSIICNEIKKIDHL